MRHHSRPAARRAFTLIELLVVVAITAILAGLMMAAVQRVRSAADRARCLNHLKQIGLAHQNYHGAHSTFPPGISVQGGRSPQPFLSWNARLLPYLEQAGVWVECQRAFAADPNFLTPPHGVRATVISMFTCPSDPRTLLPSTRFGAFEVAFTAYLGVVGADYRSKDGVLYLDSQVRIADVGDGTSQTLIVGERPPSPDQSLGWWYAGWGQSQDGSAEMLLGVRELKVMPRYGRCPDGPYHFVRGTPGDECDTFHFWSLHPGGAHFLAVDGSAHFLRYHDDAVLPALASRSGGEVFGPPF